MPSWKAKLIGGPKDGEVFCYHKSVSSCDIDLLRWIIPKPVDLGALPYEPKQNASVDDFQVEILVYVLCSIDVTRGQLAFRFLRYQSSN